MNKKMIMLISALVCASTISAALKRQVQRPFETVGEQSEYQKLIDKFKFNELVIADNTIKNIDLLKRRESYLSQQIKTQGQNQMWPYWLAAMSGPASFMSWGVAVNVLDRYDVVTVLEKPFEYLMKTGYVIDSFLGLPNATWTPGLTAIASISLAPMIAFYGLYKKYSSLQNLQQEIEMIRNMLAVLNTFGQPTGSATIKNGPLQLNK